VKKARFRHPRGKNEKKEGLTKGRVLSDHWEKVNEGVVRELTRRKGGRKATSANAKEWKSTAKVHVSSSRVITEAAEAYGNKK